MIVSRYRYKGMAIPVYYLRTKDGGIGFAFKHGDKCSIYTYCAVDLFDWRGDRRGQILKYDILDPRRWIESTQLLVTSAIDLMKYDSHIVSWARSAGPYSLFEKLGVTSKSFAEETLRFFISVGDRMMSLISPRITCHYIEYRTKTRIDMLQMTDIENWYRMLESLDYDENSLLQIIAESGEYYYSELIEGESRHYHLTGVTIRYDTVSLNVDPPASLTPASLAPAAIVGVNHCTTTVTATACAVNPPHNQTGLLVIVFLFTILIVLIVIAVLILEYNSESELIGPHPVEGIPSVVPV